MTLKHKSEINDKKGEIMAVNAYTQMLEQQDERRDTELKERKSKVYNIINANLSLPHTSHSKPRLFNVNRSEIR